MSTDLLTPRFKVMEDYPFSCLRVGFIITEPLPLTHPQAISGGLSDLDFVAKYPNIFKELVWWQDRPIEWFYPIKYLRYGDLDKRHMIYEVGEWDLYNEEQNLHGAWDKNNEGRFLPLSLSQNVHPATEEEYLNFINSKKP